MARQKVLRHLRVDGPTSSEKYRPPAVVVPPSEFPKRDRTAHGKKLVKDLNDTQVKIDTITEELDHRPAGFNLTLQGEKSLEQVLKSLNSERQGIELANVRPKEHGIEATVFVPHGKLSFFTKKVQDYLDPGKDTTKGKPKNAPLVSSINQIGLAALKNFWTDTAAMPELDTTTWWEVWVRSSGGESAGESIFHQEAARVELQISPHAVRFPDRVVHLAFGKLRAFKDSFLLLDTVAEIRKAKECPTEFFRLPAAEQKHWIANLLGRTTFAKRASVSVCVLDTGIDRGNPLLTHATDADHVLTCFPAANPADHDGHGTEMAGLSLFGDLEPVVAGKQSVEVNHCLESVKILPAAGANHPDHYAAITEQAAYRIESVNPHARRAFCLAVTTTDFRDRGQPTAWSGTLDKLSFGETEDTPKRLFLVSAGNTDLASRHDYLASNLTDGIHDPAQSWNAITVGAYADRVMIRSPGFAGWTAIAQTGELCPASTTSCIWKKPWPLKPDFVLEGGNCALNPTGGADTIDDLSILTTSRLVPGRLFSLTGDTSAATALAARMAATIHATYPDYWPETVRALLVHSAEWTEAMNKQFPGKKKKDVEKRLQCVGFGIPNLDRAMWCAGNSLTLVSQSSILPFEGRKSTVSLRQINLHEIPWPTAELRALGEAEVTMRVTLSYFVEPSPGMRGWTQKFRYASHGLRFEVRRPRESTAKFQARLNQLAREEEGDGAFKAEGEKQAWKLGPKLRSRGSVHSDWWTGTAADLADCNLLGVFPVSGWWKERPKFERWKREVRYSLIISIATPVQTADLYTPVENQIATAIPNAR